MSETYMRSILDLVNAAEDSSSSGMTAGGKYLSESLNSALAELSSGYGASSPVLSSPDAMGEQYAEMFASIAESFSSLFSELNAIRSSYLPFELAQEIPLSTGETKTFEEIIDTEAVLESYENAFFRMLGMPSSENLRDDYPLLAVSSNGELLQDNYGLLKHQYTFDVLDVRQLTRTSRPIQKDNGIYDFLSASHDPIARLERAGFTKAEEFLEITAGFKALRNQPDPGSEASFQAATHLDALISEAAGDDNAGIADRSVTLIQSMLILFGPNWQTDYEDSSLQGQLNAAYNTIALRNKDTCLSLAFRYVISAIEPDISSSVSQDMMDRIFKKEVLGEQDSTLMSAHVQANFWGFAYLLFPPVQDGRIGRCINEPRKMIAEPFLPDSLRTINGATMKSTLLEAVIRIRLDSITGTAINVPDPSTMAPVTVGVKNKNVDYSQVQEQLGLLEALVVTRLFSALHGFAIDVREKIKEMHFLQHQTGTAPALQAIEESDNARTTPERREFCELAGELGSEICRLETIKVIEDSLMLLLGDTEAPGALELQEGTARNSSIKSAHLMSAVVSIMGIPGRWADSQLERIDAEVARLADKGLEEPRSQVASKLGISKGVGAIDVLAYLIAFFTVPEKTLLSLLTDNQFSYLKLEFPNGFFDNYEEANRSATKMDQAVNDVALRAYDAYQLFRYTLENPGGVFVHAVNNASSTSDEEDDE